MTARRHLNFEKSTADSMHRGAGDLPEDYIATLKDSFANRYKKQIDPWSIDPIQVEVQGIFVDWIGAGRRRILDVGTGVGRDARRYAEAGHAVTGIDIVEHSAWLNAPAVATQDLQFKQDTLQTHRPAHRYDFVCDNGCLHHQHPQALEEYLNHIHALLTPDGGFLLSVFADEEATEVSIENDGRYNINFSKKKIYGSLEKSGFFIQEEKTVDRHRLTWRYFRLLFCKK